MKRPLILTAFCTTIIAPAALISSDVDAKQHAESAEMKGLDVVLANADRAEDAPRDQYRRPRETLQFFGLEPDMTIAEYGPGGGWYTRILLPYVAPKGKYIAVGTDSDVLEFSNRAREARSKSWPERFPGNAAEWTGISAESIKAYESDEVPEEMLGTVDRILIFRSLHGMMGGNRADSELRSLRKLLKDNGKIGVVQHRANANAPFAYANGSKGYLKQKDVIALFELNGFELVKSSEINANPKDTKDYEIGVWTLPPRLATADDNPSDKAKYDAIGESDRMTLLFKKAP
ncbi:class I SAM-dependent methyltransferase [Sphingorhabdus sp. Alg239-R122]|uniref:class I SAM-dependent methyltransferase n=1 Tax=Sphingorhabdus sp. Alg239-R122 TaxID=2305989 RepID=UPI0013DB25A1|nr:class I SAM-dependent methyltransferase [Sphingorhabdus sp. Alg239-R122]